MADYTERGMLDLIHATWGCVLSQGRSHRYVIAEHVNDGAGFSYGRTLDAVMLDTWPSKGLGLHGFEVKVSKSDLRRELQDLSKAYAFIEHLDYFSIVAPAEIIDMNIIPAKWGVYCPDKQGGKLRARRKPLMLHDPSDVVDRSIMAAFTRALRDRGREADLVADIESRAYDRGYANGLADGGRDGASLKRRADQILEQVRLFEQRSGVHIDTYHGADIGDAVKFVMRGGMSQCDSVAVNIEREAVRLQEVAAALRASKIRNATEVES